MSEKQSSLTPDPTGRTDLWCVSKDDMGKVDVEAALVQWRQASSMLDGLCDMAEHQGVEALYVALTDCRARAYEEVRRHEREAKMRREWAEMVETGRAG